MPIAPHFGLQDPRLQSVAYPMIIPQAISTAGNVTYTPAQLMSGWINRDGNGGARTDTLPSASALAAAIQGVMVNTSFEFELRNTSSTAIAITLAGGAGVTFNPVGSNRAPVTKVSSLSITSANLATVRIVISLLRISRVLLQLRVQCRSGCR